MVKSSGSAKSVSSTKTSKAGSKTVNKHTNDEYMFNPGDFVVYPAHGVGQVVEIKSENIGGQKLDFVAVNFQKEKATVKIPISKLKKDSSSLRQLSSDSIMDSAVRVLHSKAKVRRVQWSRRSQEYMEKIKSNNPIALAEVLRDLYKDPDKSEQTYSERQIYDQAFGLFVPEYALVHKIKEDEASVQLSTLLKNRSKLTD
jgi:CarD family transcriptional regulator